MTLYHLKQDQHQRQQALDTSRSFIIQAPAGSGKTELIIQRFLSLLDQVKFPEEILAITFTKKAANEMRSRIMLALQQAMDSTQPESLHSKQTWILAKKVLYKDKKHQWNLINNPNQLRIQTIDSLCAYLTRQLPLLSRFGSSPMLMEQPSALYREAVQEVLTHLEDNLSWSPALQKLLLHLDNDLNKLYDLLIELLAKRDQWLPYIHLTRNKYNIRKLLEHHFSEVISEKLRFLKALFPKDLIEELLAIARFSADQLAIDNCQSEIIACRELIELPDVTSGSVTAWLGLAKLLITKNKSWRKRVDKEIGCLPLSHIKNFQSRALHTEFRMRYQLFIDNINTNEELRLALANLFYLPKAEYEGDQWEILQALLSILKIAAAQLQVEFKQYGQIDFIENAQAALLALGDNDNPTDLTLTLDYQIRHILVDEFQDTSLTQYRLLEKLIAGWEANDSRTLFIVGDPMQSIYRFREAEVGLFLQIWKYGLGHIKLVPLRLSVNFRSTTKIIEWNNHLFQGVFPAYNDIALGAVTYHCSISSDNCYNVHTPEIHGFVTDEDREQVQSIVSLINKIKMESPIDSIAILVRSRSNLISLLPVLKQEKIAYQAIDIEPLASRQIIQDLLSLTCALLHPHDRIAWLALLRSSWCGLTLADLLTIAGNDSFTTIWKQLESKEVIDQLTEDGQQRITRILPIIKSKIEDRERLPLRYWIESTWLLLGGPACLRDYSDIDDVNTYFELLELIYQQNLAMGIDLLKSKVEQLYASSYQGNDEYAIQIMTIHAAKGLEFDTVIIPHLESTIPSNDRSALLLAPIHSTGSANDAMYEFIYKQKKIKSKFESDRLLYVATTRAKKRLHLLFNINKNSNGDYKVPSGSFLEKIWSQISTVCHLQSTKSTIRDDSARSNRYIIRLPASWQNPITAAIPLPVAYHHQQTGFTFKESKSRVIGMVIHKILQLISTYGITWWSLIDDHYIKRQLIQSGIFIVDVDSAILIIRRAISNTLNDSRGKWILYPHDEAKSEFAINAVIDGEVQGLVLDRTFIDER